MIRVWKLVTSLLECWAKFRFAWQVWRGHRRKHR
jgi:hypothetical protein